MELSRNAYRVLVGIPEGKRPLRKQRHSWEDNIEMDMREVDCDAEDWINLAQDRIQWRAYISATMNLLKSQLVIRLNCVVCIIISTILRINDYHDRLMYYLLSLVVLVYVKKVYSLQALLGYILYQSNARFHQPSLKVAKRRI